MHVRLSYRITLKSQKSIIHYIFNKCHGVCLGVSVVLK